MRFPNDTMAFTFIRPIPTPEEILRAHPLPAPLARRKAERDRAIIATLTGRRRLLVIIGPCSAHDEDAVLNYTERLARVQEEVADRLVLVPRIYTNKPRTTGEGYKGMVHQPHHRRAPNMAEGIVAIRRLHIRALQATGLSAADEMLYPGNYPYLADLLSYVAIGARSVENQLHRMTVSGLDVPVGMKNPTSGDLSVMFNSVRAAQIPHTFIYNGWEVATTGNPLAHVILRGAVDRYGLNIPNYHYEDLIRTAEMYRERPLRNPAIIVDTNHANSGRQHREQPRIAMEVMYSRRNSPLLASMVKGFLVESFLADGCQSSGGRTYGKSITDPCLGWPETRKLLLKIASLV